ncbi:MAG TPA: ABC transporter permease [Pyrinomonadaceae bacterium]|jgi:putative ABC transport system permease protein|nr:ABC transporter permease [Pyrinomonadaceae bacterium]
MRAGGLRALVVRLGGLSGRVRRDREMADELESHLRMQIDDNLRAGMSPAEARRRALVKLGGAAQALEECRRRRGFPVIEDFWKDLRYGARGLLRQPGFTLVAALTLALGIGANTALFSVINAVLLRPLPFAEHERVVSLFETYKPSGESAVSVPNLLDWRRQSTAFEGMAAYEDAAFNLDRGDGAQRLRGMKVEANYFDVLGARPRLGRAFLKGEDEAGRDSVAVLSDSLWREGFGADPGVVGKTVPLNGQKYTVVGVMPPALSAVTRAQVWTPLVFPEGERSARGGHDYYAVGRLKPGVSPEQARQELSVIAARLEQQYPGAQAGRGAGLREYREELVGDVRRPLLMLMGAVLFVLLIACTNVANLLLARAAGRHRETALRVALGAGRLRLVRQFMTEGLLLSVLGGAVGVATAWLGLDLLSKLAFEFLPRSSEIRLDLRVLGFTLLVCVLTGLVFGVAPAAQALKTDVQEALKDGGKGSAVGSGGAWMRNALAVTQIAAAFVLLIGAGLLVKSFARLRSVDSGLKPENVLTARFSLTEERYRDAETARRFYREVLERVAALPGVEAAGVTSHLSVEEYGTNGFVEVEGKSYPPNGEPLVELRIVSPDYFRAVGVRLVRGSLFDEREAKDAPPGVVVNETMARAVWPGEDPLGKRVAGRPVWPGFVAVVGVVSDVKNMGLTRPTTPEFYFDYTRANEGMLRNMTLAVRSRLDAASLAAGLRREAQSVDPGQPVYDVRTMQSVLDDTVSDRRLNMTLLGVLAALSLALAVVGVYGVMSYNVTRHTREIGIRLALGAQRADIHRLVLGRGAALALAGVLSGLAAALGLTRMMSGLLFDVSATDPATFGGIAALLFAAALVACYVPARRAVKVDPLIALRYE